MSSVIALTDPTSVLADTVARAAAGKNWTVRPWDDRGGVQPALVLDTSAWRGQFDPARLATIAAECAGANWPLMLISSARVLGTMLPAGPHFEFSEPAPADAVGERFATAERVLTELVPASVIVRVPWLVDAPGELLDQLLERLIGTSAVAVSDRVRGCPVQLEDVGRTVVAMARQIACGAANWGVFHHRTVDHCSEAELADLLARTMTRAGRSAAPLELVAEGPTTPPPAWLEGTRLTDDFGIQLRSWRHGMKSLVTDWLARNGANR